MNPFVNSLQAIFTLYNQVQAWNTHFYVNSMSNNDRNKAKCKRRGSAALSSNRNCNTASFPPRIHAPHRTSAPFDKATSDKQLKATRAFPDSSNPRFIIPPVIRGLPRTPPPIISDADSRTGREVQLGVKGLPCTWLTSRQQRYKLDPAGGAEQSQLAPGAPVTPGEMM